MKDRAMRCAEGIQEIQDDGGFDSIEQMADFIRTFYRENRVPVAESPSLRFLDTGRDE